MQDFLERAGCHRAGLSLSRAVIFRKTATSRKAACHFNLKIFAQARDKILTHAQDKICTYTEKFHFTLQFLRETAEFSRKIVCVTHVFSICRKNCFLYTRIHKFLDMGSRKISIYTIRINSFTCNKYIRYICIKSRISCEIICNSTYTCLYF